MIWRKTFWKLLRGFLWGAAAGAVSQAPQVLSGAGLDPQQVGIAGAVVGALDAIINYLKNRKK